MRSGARSPSPAAPPLAGQWMLYNGQSTPGTRLRPGTANSHEESLSFDGRGNFRWSSTTQVVVSPGGSAGGMAGSATSDGDQGTYTVTGHTLVYEGPKGQLAVDFQLGNGELIAGASAIFGSSRCAIRHRSVFVIPGAALACLTPRGPDLARHPGESAT